MHLFQIRQVTDPLGSNNIYSIWVWWERKLSANDCGNFSQNVSIKALVRYDDNSWIPVLGNKTCIILHYGSLYRAVMCGVLENTSRLFSCVLPTRTAHFFGNHAVLFLYRTAKLHYTLHVDMVSLTLYKVYGQQAPMTASRTMYVVTTYCLLACWS